MIEIVNWKTLKMRIIAKGVIQQSDNIEYLINKQSQTEEKLTDIQQTLKLILSKLDK